VKRHLNIIISLVKRGGGRAMRLGIKMMKLLLAQRYGEEFFYVSKVRTTSTLLLATLSE
jgi:hypothetical protein